MHLLEHGRLPTFRSKPQQFSDAELEGLKSRITDFIKPCPLNELAIQSADGRLAEGELIVLPQVPSDLLALSEDEAVELVQSAVDLGVERGAEVVGLAGFSSIMTFGGTGVEGAQRREGDQRQQLHLLDCGAGLEAACAKHGISWRTAQSQSSVPPERSAMR